jgi:hypothetical protein
MMPIFIKSNISEMAERYANCVENAQKYLKTTDENIILIAGTMKFIIEVDKMSLCYGVKL